MDVMVLMRLPIHSPLERQLQGALNWEARTKKADVAEHPEVFGHVGLLVNGLPGAAELPFN
jgi:hypothetical protein